VAGVLHESQEIVVLPVNVSANGQRRFEPEEHGLALNHLLNLRNDCIYRVYVELNKAAGPWHFGPYTEQLFNCRIHIKTGPVLNLIFSRHHLVESIWVKRICWFCLCLFLFLLSLLFLFVPLFHGLSHLRFVLHFGVFHCV